MTLRRKTVSDTDADSWIFGTRKDALCRSLTPPCKGILPLSAHPPPQDHVPKCQEQLDESNTFFCETAGEPPNVSPSSERDVLAVGERIVPCGEKPTTFKTWKMNHWNGKWHQKVMYWISFQQECLSFYWSRPIARHQLMLRYLKNKDSATCDTYVFMSNQQKYTHAETHTYMFIQPKHNLLCTNEITECSILETGVPLYVTNNSRY